LGHSSLSNTLGMIKAKLGERKRKKSEGKNTKEKGATAS
jgi:hypothetical protein